MSGSIIKRFDSWGYRRLFIPFLVISFCASFCATPFPLSLAAAQEPRYPGLPAPGAPIDLSQPYRPALIQGLEVFPENPLQFNFIVQQGDERLQDQALRQNALRMIRYFMASVTIPKKNMWVNLSPHEQDRIISSDLGATGLGKDLLMQDYMLKQLSASLLSPEGDLGRRFWSRLRRQAQKQFPSAEIPFDMYNKIWIVPDKAVIYENNHTAFILDRHLNVMLDQDYQALRQSSRLHPEADAPIPRQTVAQPSSLTVMRQVILPAIEKEVNHGRSFAKLRQIYNAMILALWYKKTLRDSLLGRLYADQGKIQGIDLDEKDTKEKIYNQYLTAFKRGVYDTIREEYDPATGSVVPRRYFSGGVIAPQSITVKDDYAQTTDPERQKLRQLQNARDDLSGIFVKILELGDAETETYVTQTLKESEKHRLLSTLDVLREVRTLFDQESITDLSQARQALAPFKGVFFYDLVDGYDKNSLIIERGQELWVIVEKGATDQERLLRHVQQNDARRKHGPRTLKETIDLPDAPWQIVRLRKGDLTQAKLIDLQLIEDNGFQTIDLAEDADPLADDHIGAGLEQAQQRVITEMDYGTYLETFLTKLKGKTIQDEHGRTIPLFINERIQTTDDLMKAAVQAQKILKGLRDSEPLASIDQSLRRVGLERGWGDSRQEILSRLNRLILSGQLSDPQEKLQTISELDEMTPTVLSAVFISTHGWFVQENAFGKPDTGGQVSFVRDEAKAMAREIAEKMRQAGIPGKAVALIFTRLIPNAENTKADQDEEIVYEDASRSVKIVRVPFSEQESQGLPLRGKPRLKNALDLVQSFIRRFEIWSYITQDAFVRSSAQKIDNVLTRYGLPGPDLILGNYSDGNFLAAKLSDHYGGTVPVTMTAHALELSKYFKDMADNGLIDNWFETEDGRYLAAQALIDAWVMRRADIIETSTLLEILGQYSFYHNFEFEKLFRVSQGIQLNDAKFMLNEPSIDRRTPDNPEGLFFAYEGPRDPRRQEFEDANALWQAKIFQAPDSDLKVFDRFKDWDDNDKPIIFTMARFDSKKNIAGLVEEFAKAGLKEQANLVIVGGNTDYITRDGKLLFKARAGSDDMNKEELAIAHKIIDLVDQHQLQGHIRWISASTVPRESAELYRVMQDHPAGAVFAQPATFEAFGLTILEAMATRLLVVATDQGGPKEIIRHGQHGFLADPETPGAFGAALTQAVATLQDAEAREMIIRSAMARIENKYNWRRRAQRTLQAVQYFSALKHNQQKTAPGRWARREQMLDQAHGAILQLVEKIIWNHQMEFIPPEKQTELEKLLADTPLKSMTRRPDPGARDDQAMTVQTPNAAQSQYGGIDLNADLLDLQIQRDENGIPLAVDQQPLDNIRIQGFMPIIMDVTPVNLPLLLGRQNHSPDGPSDPGSARLSAL